MSDDLEQRVIRLSLQHLILRDFVVWLLGREVRFSPDPNSTIRLASDSVDTRIHNLPTAGRSEDCGDLAKRKRLDNRRRLEGVGVKKTKPD
jgi:hypothetical protein